MSGWRLRPCPFCGGAPSLALDKVRKDWHPELVVSGVRVACSCGATTQRVSTEESAVESWNNGHPVHIQRVFGGN